MEEVKSVSVCNFSTILNEFYILATMGKIEIISEEEEPAQGRAEAGDYVTIKYRVLRG